MEKAEKKYNRIKILLAEKDIKQKDLAIHLNVGVVSVSRWCANEAQPSIDTFYKIANFFEVDICELLNRDIDLKKDNPLS